MKKPSDYPLALLERLVDEHGEQLFRFAYFRTGCRADAEDAVQEAFLRFASADTARITHPKAYLFRTVANACTDRLRRRPRLQPLSGQLSVPEEDAPAREEYERIERLLGQLPAEQADVIRLRTAGELRFTEIAQLLDCPVTTVKSRFRYGIDKLKELLNR